jgi:hypothetical protein
MTYIRDIAKSSPANQQAHKQANERLPANQTNPTQRLAAGQATNIGNSFKAFMSIRFNDGDANGNMHNTSSLFPFISSPPPILNYFLRDTWWHVLTAHP